MLEIVINLVNQSVFPQLNSVQNPEDLVANNVMFNQKCWVKMQQGDEKITKEVSLMTV